MRASSPVEARPVAGSSEAVEATTRERVMIAIVERGRATAAELADLLGLTQAGVRRHLLALEAEGLVMVRPLDSALAPARHAGRPAKIYVATDEGRDRFAHAYDELAIDALEFLRRLGGPEAVADFAKEKFAAIEARSLEVEAEHPEWEPAQALSQALTEDGFMAALLPVEHGDAGGEQLCQRHCPYAAVAARFPEFCSAETEVFARLLNSHVQRLATIAHGDGVCTTNIPAPLAPSVRERALDPPPGSVATSPLGVGRTV
ncbi:MAG: winged helix-turn-helix transcriptional regulator [Propionibacteriaceae bacterium]|jgi:predicted ArsR family transcriptional regulator|nr:winged helix-turn-helix transcriptional regulator [Propionibacteriaceae bacterium]